MLAGFLQLRESAREERFARALRACVRWRRDGQSAKAKAYLGKHPRTHEPSMTIGDVSSGVAWLRTDISLSRTH